MQNQILCPHCKKNIPLSDALSHEIREEFRRQAADYARKKDAEYREKIAEIEKKFESENAEKKKKFEEDARRKIEQEIKFQIENTRTEAEDLKKRNADLHKQLVELTRAFRELQTQLSQKDLEVEKRLLAEQQKIKSETQTRVAEEYKFKLAEQQKKIDDMQNALEDAKRKSEQGSQQLQGEVLELEIENALKQQFPHDEVRGVAKGTRGGDVIQTVKSNNGRALGTILWELKRTRDWSNSWIPKLKNDQRVLKAEVAVIISDAIPGDINNFGWKDGVWVGKYGCFMGLAYAVRHNIMDVARLRAASDGKKEKMEVLYNYIYGLEFRQRIEAIVESFQNMQQEVEKEKRFFALKWARQEGNIRKVMDNTFGMRGDLESITGKELGDGIEKELEALPEGQNADIAEQEPLL